MQSEKQLNISLKLKINGTIFWEITDSYLQKKEYFRWFRHVLVFFTFICLIKLYGLLPVFIMKKTGFIIGLIGSIVLFKHKKQAKKHLKNSFPDWSSRQVKDCTRKMFIHFSLAFTDFICVINKKSTLRVVVDEEKILRTIQTCPRLIFLTGHIGNWELLPFLIKDISSDLKLTIVARSQSNRFLNHLLEQFRNSQGFTMLDRKKNPYKLFSSLAHASHLAFLADQSLKTSRIDRVLFFGQEAPTPSALSLIAQKRKFAFLPVFCIRRETGLYELIVCDPFEATNFSTAFELTQHYTFIIEKIVRQFPEQWVWFHQRWREKT